MCTMSVQLPVPDEVRQQLLSDTQMQPIYSRLATSFDYAQVYNSLSRYVTAPSH